MGRATKITQEQFITRSSLLHNNIYTYGNVVYVNAKTKVSITCRKHGSFMQTPSSHVSGHGCLQCYQERAALKFLDRAAEIHGDRYDYSRVEYIGCFDKICIVCTQHGDFWQQPNAHIGKQQQGCPHCHRERENARLATISRQMGEEFASKSDVVHECKYNYSKVNYTRSWNKVEIVCPVHGSFWQTPNNHLRGKGCYDCQPGGFTDKLPGFVYVLREGDTTKVGITNKTPYQRANYLNWVANKCFKVVSAFKFPDGANAQVVEKNLLYYLRQKYKNPEVKHHGSTECFIDVCLADVISQLVLFSVKHDIETYELEQ